MIDIVGNLRDQRIDRVKLGLPAHMFNKFNFERLAIQVALEIEHMGFDLPKLAVKRRRTADTDRALLWCAVDHNPPGIDAVGWNDQVGHLEVGGRKPDLPPTFGAFDYGSFQRKRSTQTVGGSAHVTFADQTANQRTRRSNFAAIFERLIERFDQFNVIVPLPGKSLERFAAALSPFAESKIETLDDGNRSKPGDNDRFDERFGFDL